MEFDFGAKFEEKVDPQSTPFEQRGGQTILSRGIFSSPNFKKPSTGWQLTPNSAEFYTGIFNIGGTVITINNTQNIQTNLDSISIAGGGTLFLQNGTYTLTADISVPAGVTLQGVSRDGVIINCNTLYKVQCVGSNAYNTGTVAINEGSTTVTGTGTVFTAAMIGRHILLERLWYEITGRASDTSITIGSAYTGSNLSGASYTLANININPTLRKLTITNATGAGVKGQYLMEPNFDDLFIDTCGTGLDLDQVVYPRIFIAAEGNGINADFNNVYGFQIDFCSFSFSTTGAGLVLLNSGNATVFDTAINGNFTNGISVTGCTDITFISVENKNNNAKGIEFISGNSDIQLIGFSPDGNTSDGIKLTATSDRITITACAINNNGGYGINIAAITCDDNVIVSPVFVSNVSGNINNLGTLTVIIADDTAYNTTTWDGNLGVATKNAVRDKFESLSASLPEQEIAYLSGTDTAYATNSQIATDTTGTTMIFAHGASINTIYLYRLTKDAVTSQWSITHSTSFTFAFTPSGFRGVAIVGSFVYVSFSDNSVVSIQRFALADLTGSTAMTFSGTARQGVMFSDNTKLYINYASDTAAKFSISGTTVTNDNADVTYTSMGVGSAGSASGIACNGTSVYSTAGASGSNAINKWALAGGAVSSTTTRVIQSAVYPNNSLISLFMNGTALGYGWGYTSESNTAVKGGAMKLLAITLP